MGGRGASSLTSTAMVTGPTGSYPKEMESLLDGKGHISLDMHDYFDGLKPKYTREQLEAFISTLPYEATAYFTPEGELVYITSQYKNGSVSTNPYTLSGLIATHDDGYVDFHNHPMEMTDTHWTYPIFSSGDIGAFTQQVWDKQVMNMRMPTVFTVRASNGMAFTLEYVGGYSRDPDGFKKAYSAAFTRARNAVMPEVRQAYFDGVYTTAIERNTAMANGVTERMDDYLRKNASKYGFRYNSNVQS